MTKETPPSPHGMEKLNEQLTHVAAQFSQDSQSLSALLEAMLGDVARAEQEPLEIVPVAHHSPSSGLHVLRRLMARQPKVIFMEMCEDMRPLVPQLGDCSVPVALQAFAAESSAFPADWAPLTVVAPLTEFGAEYQAMAYALEYGVELVFVDRSVDHIFQWMPQREDAMEKETQGGKEDPQSEGDIDHGSALGIEFGSVVPTIDEFVEFLLRNARVNHFSQWWEQYVEHTVIEANWETYRRVMFLMGSLLRRLGRKPEDVESDRARERYMWTRMKQHLQAKAIDPTDAIYICGACHSASDVAEFGVHSPVMYDIPPLTDTPWLYGIIPSSYSAIERQFGHPPGTISIAQGTWEKSMSLHKLKPKKITKTAATGTPKAMTTKVRDTLSQGDGQSIDDFLTTPPKLEEADLDQLLGWSVDVVKLARKNGYLTSTADSIAIYHTSILLAGMRSRRSPSPYDFRDAAITCLEKGDPPKKRDVGWLCDILLGGDRVGRVGYASLPELAQNVYDRLSVLPVNLKATTIQRALMDFKAHPEYRQASNLLWKLHYLLGPGTVSPITGERSLGHKPIQESWDIKVGKNQRGIIELAYEGVTVEQVIDQRLRKKISSQEASAVDALGAVIDSILYVESRRLTDEIGDRAVFLLREESGAGRAPQIFEMVRELVHYYRSQPDGLAGWIERFIATGYSHYATMLPESFKDKDTSPADISGMLSFIFTLESLALSLGCDRSELLIAVGQIAQEELSHDKIGLLWSAQYLLGIKPLAEIQAFFDEAVRNPMLLPVLPAYVSGFVMALRFTPLVSRLVVELLSKVFGHVPDRVLMPWIPSLLMALKPLGDEFMPLLLKEASLSFPGDVSSLPGWQMPWERARVTLDFGTSAKDQVPDALGAEELAVHALLLEHREGTSALADLLGGDGTLWRTQELDRAPLQGGVVATDALSALVQRHGETREAIERLMYVS